MFAPGYPAVNAPRGRGDAPQESDSSASVSRRHTFQHFFQVQLGRPDSRAAGRHVAVFRPLPERLQAVAWSARRWGPTARRPIRSQTRAIDATTETQTILVTGTLALSSF